MWAGDLDTHRAVQVVLAYYNNGGRSECVAERGLTWHWEAAISGASVPSYFTGSVLVVPPARILTYEPQVNALAGRLEKFHGVSPPEAVDRALDACETAYQGELLDAQSEERVGRFIHPRVVDDLSAAWTAAVRRAMNGVGDQRDVLACFADADLGPRFAGTKPDADGANLIAAVEKAVPRPERIPVDGEQTSAAWQRALDMEAVVVTALWRCHEDSYEEAMQRLLKESERFALDHAEQIQQAADKWAEVERVARTMGWTPERPLGNYEVPKGKGSTGM